MNAPVTPGLIKDLNTPSYVQNAQLIALTQAEKWNGVLPATMVPGGTVPFLNLKANSGND